jgi:hypothetical protein
MLVRRGLITPDQLTAALAEQKASGQPLGAIVVARGFAAPATIAQALATQHGGLLKTEYGFATGFGTGVNSPVNVGEPPVSSVRITGKGGASVAVATETTPLPATTEEREEADRDAVREEMALASAETTRLTEANERLAVVRDELEQRLGQEKQRYGSTWRPQCFAVSSSSSALRTTRSSRSSSSARRKRPRCRRS